MTTRPKRIVAIIPARGGSQRVPQKNLALLAGKPLIAHTIAAACSAHSVSEVYVSTDDTLIAATSRKLGAQVIDRPAALATAESPTEPSLIHAVQTLEARDTAPIDVVVLLQATSPLRGPDRIDACVSLLLTSRCDSVVSVTPSIDYYFLGDLDESCRLRVGYDPDNRLRTQDIPRRYRENGAVYAMTRTQLIERGCRMGGDMRAVVMSDEESIDIDTALDLAICEALLAQHAGNDSPNLQGGPKSYGAPLRQTAPC